jgi:uncharacterized membrane protein
MPTRRTAEKKIAQKKNAAPAHQNRAFSERIADWCTSFFGTPSFFILHIVLFFSWILYNGGVIPDTVPIDPYPFNFLTTAVSLEAIFLSIVVLMSQNRAARIANIRDEVDLQINVQSEREITKILEMLTTIERRLHVAQKTDPELLKMLQNVDMDELERRVVKMIERSGK